MSAGATTSKSQWPFSPQSIPGLSLWLDGADTSSITGTSTVTAWKDKSGKGNNASGTGGLSYTAGQGITFNGSNGYFSVPGVANSIVGTPFTVFVVEKLAVLPPSGQPMGIFSNDPNTGVLYGDFFTCYQPSGAVTFGWYGADQTTSTTYSPGTTRIFNFNYTGSNRTILVNGTSAATESWTQNLITGAFTQPVIGRLWGTYYYNGTISEIMLYVGNINTQQYRQVEGYLAQKWGLQMLLPPTHPYFAILPVSTPPTSISGLSLWLDATDSSTKVTSGSGTNLVSIRDKSGSGNLWTPVTPNTIAANSTINSRSALSLGSTSALLSGTYTLTAGYNSTIFAVVRCNDGGINIFGDYGPSINAGLLFSGPSLEFFNAPDYDYDSNAYDIVAPSNPNFILCARVSATDSGSTYICTVNGTEYSVDQPNTALASTGTRVITTSSTGPSDNVELLIGEILVYSVGFNMSQIRQVEGYLAWKWGIQGNLPSTHPYYYAPSALQLYQRPVFQRAFQPVDIPGLSLWLDAADATTVTGTTSVTNVADKSGNNVVLSSATGFSYPNNTFNGGKYPSFYNPISGYLGTGSNYTLGINTSFSQTTPFTVFFVAHYTAATDFPGYIMDSTSTSGRPYTYQANISTPFGNASTNVLANPCVISMNWIAGTSQVYVNGTLNYSGTLGTLTTTGITIGNRYSLNESWPGHICEFIWYSGTLTSSQRQQVESYLAWKWGLVSPLSTGHPGKLIPSFSTTFTPKSVTGLSLWLDAADSSTVTGTSAVTSWTDKSGQGYDMVNGGGTTTYTTYGPGPSIKLNTSYLYVNKAVNLLQYTVFSVLLSQTAVGNQPTITGRPNTSASYSSTDGFGLYVDSDYPRLRFYGTNSSYPTYNNTTAGTNAQPLVLSSYTCSSAGVVFSWINGAAGGSTTSGGSARTTTAQGFSIGGEWNGSAYVSQSGTGCVANVYEVIVFNTALTTSQRQQVEGYLSWKWGLQNNLPDTHAYKKIKP